MPIDHVVVEGDHLVKIAERYGFADFRTIWDHPSNADLKEARGNPNVLFPGDVIHVPDKTLKAEIRSTDALHRFQRLRPALLVRLALKGADGLPLANVKVALQVEGETFNLVTNGDGVIEHPIRSTAENGRVTTLESKVEAPLAIGHLHPVDEISGWRARLDNLGYGAGSSDSPDDPRVRSAVEEFQCDRGLPVHGDMDAATRAALVDAHGC